MNKNKQNHANENSLSDAKKIRIASTLFSLVEDNVISQREFEACKKAISNCSVSNPA